MTKKKATNKTEKSEVTSSPFAGNGLSRTAMLFKIATVAHHKLTVPEMNKFKDVNPRGLERVYDEVVRLGDAGNALFALRLLLQ